MSDWYRFTSKKATFAVAVENGIVVDAAPIAKRSIGRSIAAVSAYHKQRFGAEISKL